MHLAAEGVQDGRVGRVDAAAGAFPLQGEAVVGGALDQEDAVVVYDEGADDEVGQARVGGEVEGRWGVVGG